MVGAQVTVDLHFMSCNGSLTPTSDFVFCLIVMRTLRSTLK